MEGVGIGGTLRVEACGNKDYRETDFLHITITSFTSDRGRPLAVNEGTSATFACFLLFFPF